MIGKAIILGIVQGLTEFLPVSSSGHLAVLERYFGINEPVMLAVFLHFGTFLSTIVFFFKPIARLCKGIFTGDRRSIEYIVYIVIGSIPIVIFALLFKRFIENTFSDPLLIALFLGFTGVVVILTRLVKHGAKRISPIPALLIGLAQMLAVFPGISRSGMTISAGLFKHIDPKEAFIFSFLLSLPAILGANILQAIALPRIEHIPSIIVGMIVSFAFGLLALKILKNIVHRWFHLFGVYCLIISAILLIVQ
jgi:undecaprenyl-diphosphatase